eukprot:scaffold6724_cov54-Cylindrotheca_fusiformis.AAC.1
MTVLKGIPFFGTSRYLTIVLFHTLGDCHVNCSTGLAIRCNAIVLGQVNLVAPVAIDTNNIRSRTFFLSLSSTTLMVGHDDDDDADNAE